MKTKKQALHNSFKWIFVIHLIFSLSYGGEILPLNKDNENKIFYCGMNPYVTSISKYRDHYGKHYTKYMDKLLYEKIENSELGEVTYEKEGFDSFIEKIKQNKDFCNNTFFITTTMEVLEYNKELKYFPIKGLTKDTQFNFGENYSLYSGTLSFKNTDPDKNKIELSGEKAKEFLEGFKEKQYNRNYIVRIYFKITDIQIDSSHNDNIGINVTTAINKIDFVDNAGYIKYTIDYDSNSEVFNTDATKKISHLDKYIDLENNRFTQLNDSLFKILSYIDIEPKIEEEKLLSVASVKIKNENNKFKKKKMTIDAEPDIRNLVEKVKNKSILMPYSILLVAEYNLDKGKYEAYCYGASTGHIYNNINHNSLYASPNPLGHIFAIKIPDNSLTWDISMDEAEKYENLYTKIYILYDLLLEPDGMATDLRLTSNEKAGFAGAGKATNMFSRNTRMEQAYENPLFYRLNTVSGERKLYGEKNEKRILLSDEKIIN